VNAPGLSGTEYGVDDTPIPFADLESACPTTEVTAARRIDPYWHGLWGDGSQASWLNRSLLERLGTDRVSRVRDTDTSRTREQAIAEILTRRRQARLTALAAVGMWRTVTAEQLTALTGLRTILDGREMLPAFQAELVERGTLITELGWRGPRRTAQIVIRQDARQAPSIRWSFVRSSASPAVTNARRNARREPELPL
jgi:hypothetical protein